MSLFELDGRNQLFNCLDKLQVGIRSVKRILWVMDRVSYVYAELYAVRILWVLIIDPIVSCLYTALLEFAANSLFREG